jgi:hypothetical protein
MATSAFGAHRRERGFPGDDAKWNGKKKASAHFFNAEARDFTR